MPLTKKGQNIMSSMKEQYGPKEGKSVFYASKNKGTISGVDKPKNKRDKKVAHRGKKFTIRDRSRA